MKRQNRMELKKNVTRCQVKKETRLTSKRSWQQEPTDIKGERSTKQHTCRSETGALNA